ncbi:MAG: SpoIIE family protein phosphatase [Pseudomonadota bacterium]
MVAHPLHVAPAPPAAPEADGALRILVVDDSKAQCVTLSAQLRRAGHAVRIATSGEDALAICHEHPVDLVLSDWMMPGMNGIDFCRAFRKLEREDYGYFILLTSKGEGDDIALGLDAGADDFLVKPVNAVELHARISAGRRILEMQRQLTDKNRLIQSTLDELKSIHAMIDRDLIEARKLQQSLVSNRHQDFGAGVASLLLRPSGHVGGDLVGCYENGAGSVGLYSIDVSGHGIASALMATRLAGALSSGAREQNIALSRDADGTFRMRPPGEVVGRLNRLLLEEMQSDQYCTIALAVVDLETGHVVLSQAGHPAPALQKSDNAVEYLGAGGLPVGLIDGAEYDQVEFDMRPGDRLLLYSDGFTECPDPAGDMLDEEGLAKSLEGKHAVTGPALLEALVWDLTAYHGSEEFPDDLSAVLFEYSGQ